jgi:acyl carrier protein
MIFDRLVPLVAAQFGIKAEDITMETSLTEDLDADSIDVVELMMAVEEEFGISEVEETALEKVKTIGDVVNYISDRVDD